MLLSMQRVLSTEEITSYAFDYSKKLGCDDVSILGYQIDESQVRFSKDRKSTRLNSSHTVIYTLSLHDALPIYRRNHKLCIRLFKEIGLRRCIDTGVSNR